MANLNDLNANNASWNTINSIDDISNEFLLNLQLHCPDPTDYKLLNLKIAKDYFDANNELMGIYHLTEAHASLLRLRSLYRYEQQIDECTNYESKVAFKCFDQRNSDSMMMTLRDLPKEWTLVQLSTPYDIDLLLHTDRNTITKPMHMTVFECGESAGEPFLVNIEAPNVNVAGDLSQILIENKTFSKITDPVEFHKLKQDVYKRLDKLIEDMDRWIGCWKFLLLGRIYDKQAEEAIVKSINEKLATFKKVNLSAKFRNILRRLALGSCYLSSKEIASVLKDVFNNKTIEKVFTRDIGDLGKTYAKSLRKRYPVILIVDPLLDSYPWESIKVLFDHPVTRIPSLHFLHSLYSHHRKTIFNGYKIIQYTKGSFIINLDRDLPKMEERMTEFIDYWLPQWCKIDGTCPNLNEALLNELTNASVFVYCGHGTGLQFISGSSIQKMNVKPVVFLFGCSSLANTADETSLEPNGAFDHYLIANSACAVGFIWKIFDVECDRLSSKIISYWIPPGKKDIKHWTKTLQFHDKRWHRHGYVASENDRYVENVSNLSSAIWQAKHAEKTSFTKYGIVIRGLPVKLKC